MWTKWWEIVGGMYRLWEIYFTWCVDFRMLCVPV